jgi:hypothetical protein
MKLSHSTNSLNRVWLSPPVPSSVAFFTSMGLSSIISTRTLSATLLFSSTFVTLSSELNPIGIFSAIFPGKAATHLQKSICCRGCQLRQQAGDRYLSYKFPSNIPGWKNHWFYIGNHVPQLPERSGKPPVLRPEWNTELAKGDMDQVDELLALIAAHKEIGVTGASVMFSFLKCRIQPIQQRHTLGFEYMGAEDPSRICAEELSDDATLIQVKWVLLDVNTVSYIPDLFSAQNPPEPVRF